MKTQANKLQKKIYVALVLLSSILILNFFSFGFIFGILLNLSPIPQVVLTFLSLFIGSVCWAFVEEFHENYKY